MKKTVALLLSVLISASVLSGCGSSENITKKETLSSKYVRSTDTTQTYNYNDGVTTAPTTYNSYASEITDFEFRLFRNYCKNNDSSTLAIAPISSALQLSYIANGTSGNTQEEIIKAICKDLSVEYINQCSSYFKSRIEAVASTVTENYDELSGKTITSDNNGYVKIYNSMIFNDNTSVKTNFLQTNADYYGNDIYRFVFSDNNTLTKLNGLFTAYSDNIFTELKSSDTIFTASYADICDTWLYPYAQTDITEGTFTSGDKSSAVNYMTSNEYYMHTVNAEGIVKYMAATPLKLILIMPNEKTAIDDYIDSFTSLEFNNLLTSIDFTQKSRTEIPEFTVNSEPTLEDMTATLTDSGLYTLFTDEAYFSNISSSEGTELNAMYDIQPKISINAAGIGGTTANNASQILSERTTELDECESSISFNRPFMFMVVDNESNIPIYMGKIDLTE